MASKKLDVVDSTKLLVVKPESKAIQIELQYGDEKQAEFDLVIAEQYWKDGNWKYSHGQVRIPCTVENAQHILTCVQEMYKKSKTLKKDVKVKETAPVELTPEAVLKAMSPEQIATMLAMAAEMAKATPKTTSKASKAAEPAELTFESTLINKRPVKKTR